MEDCHGIISSVVMFGRAIYKRHSDCPLTQFWSSIQKYLPWTAMEGFHHLWSLGMPPEIFTGGENFPILP